MSNRPKTTGTIGIAPANLRRRRIFGGGIGAASMLALPPWTRAWAQSEGAIKLLRLPKVALVMGNGKYEDSKVLKNPVNDAQAISASLKSAGFEVTTHLDMNRDAMLAAVRTYTGILEKRQCVGLFYFAGHGAQLAWRNYLLPVDAVIDGIEDIPKQCVDLEVLIGGVRRASNPMNIIILDACRDNPFGRDFRVNEKGLSQMDAPSSTLLAYATSPGNYASDGEGVNGLYTENLLRELKVPDTRIEDVFKRVRLNVRKRSNGQQIPWESTSLEEDFYFLPPKELKKLSEQERERLYVEELVLWSKISESTMPAPIEDYLRRYPGGVFSELGQLYLDRLLARQGEKKIVAISDAANPFTKGTAFADTGFKIGDTYSFRRLDPFSKVEQQRTTEMVSKITDFEIQYDTGRTTDLLGNAIRGADGSFFTSLQYFPTEYRIGKRWTTRFKFTNRSGLSTGEMDFTVVARESVTVPAGTFNAFRSVGRGFFIFGTTRGELELQIWHAPDKVRRPLITIDLRKIGNQYIVANRSELVSYKQS
ncbi:MAG: caspase family protein [Betaproteobacteria bacterium]|nr:caspase family protein [Betaproteobacteria bacterium]